MFKLIIIDDEVNIREGISVYVTRRHPEIDVVGCFEDGADAIEFLEHNEVDIVLTDVKMFSVSGIEVAKFVSRRMPAAKVIILSGYREFEYAREAISYNVKHYLMKPTDFNELSTVLEEMINELSEEGRRKKHVSYYEKYIPMFKEELLNDLLMGAIRDKNALASKFELLETGMKLDDCSFCVVNLFIENYQHYLTDDWMYGKEQLNEATNNFIESQNKEDVFLFPVLNENETVKLIGIMSRKSDENLYLSISEHLNDIILCAEENLKIRFKFEIEKIYPTVEAMLDSKALVSDQTHFEEQIRLLISHINLGNLSHIDSLVYNFSQQFSDDDLYNARQKCHKILLTIASRLDGTEHSTDYEKELSNIDSIQALAEYLKSEFTRISKQLKENGEEQKVIERAKEFIGNNFGSDISLVDVANHVFLNPAYFSRYFKQYTGMNFTAYLLEIRMKHAKKLLTQGHSPEEVARECGYSSSRYFSQTFKRYTGLTPKAYRLNESV